MIAELLAEPVHGLLDVELNGRAELGGRLACLAHAAILPTRSASMWSGSGKEPDT
jgi:hypothetical protein